MNTFGKRSQAACLLAVLSGVGFNGVFAGRAAAQLDECCEPAYRLQCQTVYEEREVTGYRLVEETVYEQQQITRKVPIWETQTRERHYQVARPVRETSVREERSAGSRKGHLRSTGQYRRQ